MKKFNIQTVAGICCVLIFLLSTGLECNDKGQQIADPSSDDCGKALIDRNLYDDFTAEDLSQRCNIYSETGLATFSFSAPEQNNVCPHKHIKVTLEIIVNKNGSSNSWIASADIMYGILFNYPINDFIVTYDENYYYARSGAEFGIKGSFGDDPGWYFPFLEIAVKGPQTCEKGVEEFLNDIHTIKIEWEHAEYKD